MTTNEAITRLEGLIREQLTPRITGDYVLLDCPYYANPGDTLIWEGAMAFLDTLPHKRLACASFSTWLFVPLDPAVTIVLNGGGNFGDLWASAQAFRLKIIESYPDNPVLILPQSVHYQNLEQLRADAACMARHKRLTICARDHRSQTLLAEAFRNEILLLPDMAFCIPVGRLMALAGKPSTRPLWLKRTDKELASARRPAAIPSDAAVRDWPGLERISPVVWLVYKLSGACDRLGRVEHNGPLRKMLARLADRLAIGPLRRLNIRTAVRLLSHYGDIYTTRLHGAIGALLLGKAHITLIDNSYGKNAAFYQSWLMDVDGVDLLDE